MPLSRSKANARGRSGSQTRTWKSSQPNSSIASQTRETPDSVPTIAIANSGFPSSRSFVSFSRTKLLSFFDNVPPVATISSTIRIAATEPCRARDVSSNIENEQSCRRRSQSPAHAAFSRQIRTPHCAQPDTIPSAPPGRAAAPRARTSYSACVVLLARA
jgi:hypothetical protein